MNNFVQGYILNPNHKYFKLWDAGKIRDWSRDELYIFPNDHELYIKDIIIEIKKIRGKLRRNNILHHLLMFYGRYLSENRERNWKRKIDTIQFIEKEYKNKPIDLDKYYSNEHKEVCYGCSRKDLLDKI